MITQTRDFQALQSNIFSENEKVRKTVFVCSYGAQVESFKQKNCRKSRDTVPLRLFLSYQGPSCPSWTPWPGRVDS